MVVSREPLKLKPPPNLIRNGDFSVWHPGSPAPSGFDAPRKSNPFSYIEPETKHLTSVPKGVRQTWQASDSGDSFFRLFRTWVTDLRPETDYRFTVQADNQSKNTVAILVYEYYVPQAVPGPERPEGARLGILEVSPTDGFQEFALDFTTGGKDVFCVMLFVKCRGDAKDFPATCIWDDWYLSKASASVSAANQSTDPAEK